MNDVIDKARKLLNLRDRATTPGEAKAAARALATMLDKHRISVAELEVQDDAEAEHIEAEHGKPLITFRRLTRWRQQLVAVLCRHYGVAPWRKVRAGSQSLHLCGRPSDIAMVRYMFTWLSSEIERLARIECASRGAIAFNSWRSGFVAGIDTQLCAARESAVEGHARAALALRSRFQESKNALLDKVKNTQEERVYRRHYRDEAAHHAGKKRGKVLHLGEKLDTGVCRALPKPR